VVAHFTAFHRSRRDVVRHLATGRRLLPELRDCFHLDDVACPVLLVWGDRDRMVTHRGSRHVLEALPDTEIVLLDGVGHCPQLEDPDRFTRALLAFAPDRVRTAA
jgi:pimeloyl-ACP methyl ester carboxylesterase